MAFRLKQALLALALAGLAATSTAQTSAPVPAAVPNSVPGPIPAAVPAPVSTPASSAGTAPAPPSDPQAPGTISGTVVDQSGAVVSGAHVKVTEQNQPQNDHPQNDPPQNHEALSGTDGQFFFPSVPPGAFQLTVTSNGFAPKTLSGTLHAGEVQSLPLIALVVANSYTEVQVGLSQVQVAEEQMKLQEKQRVLGVIPNFYVSYIPNAAPLNARQKFHLAARTLIDPFTIAIVAGTAGIQQAQNHFAQYGQGAQGYGKRFGANYADTVNGTLIGSAILPAILHQDPRYFYKGTGSKVSRFGYAVANALICKGDNGRWQPNYSNVMGNIAAGGISNLYYPDQDKSDAALTFENAGIGIASTAVANVFQEFIVRHLTPKLNNRGADASGGD
jgi:Carboxypeptidase regulatory-like domain